MPMNVLAAMRTNVVRASFTLEGMQLTSAEEVDLEPLLRGEIRIATLIETTRARLARPTS